MRTVLHVLPHPGGGAETYIDVLEGLEGYRHERAPLSGTRARRRGAAEVLARWPVVARRARKADLVHVHGDTAAILAGAQRFSWEENMTALCAVLDRAIEQRSRADRA